MSIKATQSLVRTLSSFAILAVFGGAGAVYATGSGSGSAAAGSSGSSASDGAASSPASAAAGDAAASSGASGPGAGSDASAGPSVPSRLACVDQSVVAWRSTPECGIYANEPIPADFATNPRFTEAPSSAVDAGSDPWRPAESGRRY